MSSAVPPSLRAPAFGALPDLALRVLALYLFHSRTLEIRDLQSRLHSVFALRVLPEALYTTCRDLALCGWLEQTSLPVSPAIPVSRRPAEYRAVRLPTPPFARAFLAHLAARRLLDDPPRADYASGLPFTRHLRLLSAFLDGPSASWRAALFPCKVAPADLWAQAHLVLRLTVSLTPPRFPAFTPPPDIPPALLRIVAAHRFHNAADLSALLDAWRALLANPAFLDASEPLDLVEYAALCVFAGRPADLSALPPRPASPAVAAYLDGCRALVAGDPASAAKPLAEVLSLAPGGRDDAYLPALLSTPAAHLLALLAQAFGKPAKNRVQRLAHHLEAHVPASEWGLPPGTRALRRLRAETGASYSDLATSLASAPPDTLGDSPWGEAGRIVQAMSSAIPRADAQRLAPAVLALAEKAAPALPTLAAAWLSAFSWAFPRDLAARSAALAATLYEAGAVWFRPYGESSTPWRQILEALGRALPDASASAPRGRAAPPKGRLVWQVLVARASSVVRHLYPRDSVTYALPAPGDLCVPLGLAAYLRGPRSPDDGSSDRPVTWTSLLAGKYDAILSDADRALLAALRAIDPTARRCPAPTSPDALAALCDIPGLTAPPSADFPAPPVEAIPAAFARRDLPLSARSTPSGGMALSVEPWCLGVTGDVALRCLAPGRYEVVSFPRPVRATLEVFAAYGDPATGLLDLPREALPGLRPLLPRIAALAPLQGELSAMGDAANLPRVPGDPAPLLRLDGNPDAPALAISLHVKPLPGSSLVLVPGAGLPERLVPRDGHSAVLVRDLDAERRNADAVRAALAPFASWQTSPDEWLVDDFPQMLRALDALRALGDAVRVEWLSPRKLAVAAPAPKAWRVSAAGGADWWFSVEGEVTLDDGTVASLSELLDAFRHRRGEFVPVGPDLYLRLSAALARRLDALAAAAHPDPKRKEALALPPAALPFLDAAFDPAADSDAGLALPVPLAERAAAVRDAFAADFPVPARLKATLRPYQTEGYAWLSRLAAAGFGACLADDMGLGKTVQIIALLLARAHDGPSLVVAPASVCGNWRAEINRFAPTLNPVMAWDEAAGDSDSALAAAGPSDVVITSYGLLVSRADAFAARTWNGLVLDEAQAIKNEETKRARAARRLSGRFRVAATGTPVENRLSDVWSLFEFLNPGLLGSPADFARRFAADGRPTPALKRLLSPLILRRVKRDVLDDLPEKTEITLPVLLSPAERAGYETVRRRALDALRGDAAQNRISILAELTRLRRYCCHPSLVLGPEAQIPAAKLDALLDLLSSLRDNGHRALVFSQFTDFLAIVRRALDSRSFTHLYLDGSTPAADRARLVDSFQRGEGDFFLVSLRAGGLGLNLTAANYVILLDPWWNPAVEQQAADRAHRIGQKRPVTVYRLVAADTVEERVLALHREKLALSADLLSDASSPALTPALLLSLFQ